MSMKTTTDLPTDFSHPISVQILVKRIAGLTHDSAEALRAFIAAGARKGVQTSKLLTLWENRIAYDAEMVEVRKNNAERAARRSS